MFSARVFAIVEQNLKTDITPDELAVNANYSVSHFCRLFAQIMDTTVASYIVKRRLDHALAEIASGQKAIGVVLVIILLSTQSAHTALSIAYRMV